MARPTISATRRRRRGTETVIRGTGTEMETEMEMAMEMETAMETAMGTAMETEMETEKASQG